MRDYAELRARMVERQVRYRGVADPTVLEAMGTVPREEFVPGPLRRSAYEDRALPIGGGQTISQPYIVALMAAALGLTPDDRVLEIGTGSGYAAAVLSRMTGHVFSVERRASLVERAGERLERLGYCNVTVLHGDGTLGWPSLAPYDAILVSAGAPRVPAPLRDQLAEGGRIVIPVGRTPRDQALLRERRGPHGQPIVEDLGPVRFVPLIGHEGWGEGSDDSRMVRLARGLRAVLGSGRGSG